MSNEEAAQRIAKRVELMLLELLPKPTCSGKLARWNWDCERVRELVSAKINPKGNGINVTVTV